MVLIANVPQVYGAVHMDQLSKMGHHHNEEDNTEDLLVATDRKSHRFLCSIPRPHISIRSPLFCRNLRGMALPAPGATSYRRLVLLALPLRHNLGPTSLPSGYTAPPPQTTLHQSTTHRPEITDD